MAVNFERPETYRYFITRRSLDCAEYEYLCIQHFDFKESEMIWSKEKSQHFDYHTSRVIAVLIKRSDVENNNYEYGLTPNDIFLDVD